MAKPKIYVKSDKNGGICDITIDGVRTPSAKRALNMFKGRNIQLFLRECLQYTNFCILAEKGVQSAEEQIAEIHRSWNPISNYGIFDY